MSIRLGYLVKPVMAVAVLALAGLQPAAAALIVDRGLPTDNLNNAAGSNRSNVAWDLYPPETYISGDDFTLPDAGGKAWRIDTIRVWVIADNSQGVSIALGDRYDTVSLFLGDASATTADRVKTSGIIAGSNATDNPDVVITPVTYSNGEEYQGPSGSFMQIWQIDFNNLGVFAPGKLMFAVDGVGPLDIYWFNHASNAALSGSPQDGADDQMLWFTGSASDASVTLSGTWDSNGSGWDKSSDHNIQVFATAVSVPEPGTLALLGFGLFAVFAAGRRRVAVER